MAAIEVISKRVHAGEVVVWEGVTTFFERGRGTGGVESGLREVGF